MKLSTCRFGRTELPISRLSLGTFQLTSDRDVERADAVAVIRRSVLAGVNLVDTAPLYGAGEAEELVGEALAQLGHRYFLIDKVGRFEAGPLRGLGENAYQNAKAIRKQFEHSLKLLRRDYVDLVLIHESDWPQWWTGAGVEDSPVIEALHGLKREGRVQCIGLSGRNIDAVCRLARSGLFDALLFVHYYNAVWQENAAALSALATEHDVGIAIGAPFKQGVLIAQDEAQARSILDKGKADASPAVWDRIIAFRELANQHQMPYGELALRYLLSQPFVHTVTVGPRSVAELEENLQWARKGALPDEVLAAVESLPIQYPLDIPRANTH